MRTPLRHHWPAGPRQGSSRQRRPFPTLGLLTLLLAGCSGDQAPRIPSNVVIQPGVLRFHAIGMEATVAAQVRDEEGRAIGGTSVTWASTQPAVATVSASGVVRAVTNGTAQVRAQFEGLSASIEVTVEQQARSWSLVTQPTEISLGDTVSPTLRLQLADSLGVPVNGGPPVIVNAEVAGLDDLFVFSVGDTTAVPANGIAEFAGLRPGVAGEAWRYEATYGGLPSMRTVPFAVRTDLATVASPSGWYNCGLTTDGLAVCWGQNRLGAAGRDRELSWTPGPALVDGPLAVSRIDAGGTTTCGVDDAGVGYCWGYNGFGKAGSGTIDEHVETPTPVQGGIIWRYIDPSGAHTCGLATDGKIWCWGEGSLLGDGEAGTPHTTVPTAVAGDLEFRHMVTATGPGGTGGHTCGIATTGVTYCWGSNAWGSLGTGTNVDADLPTAVVGGYAFVQLAGGGYHTCGLIEDGTAYCWGGNVHGQLGVGATTGEFTCNMINPCSEPLPVSGGIRFSSLSAGYDHTCGIALDGTTYCWGRNGGRLGDATTENRAAPVPVSGGLAFVSVQAGVGQTCGMAGDGRAYCWGENNNTSLGVGGGSSDLFLVPTRVLGQR